MANICSSFSISPIVIVLIFLSSFACGASSIYGDAIVNIHKDGITKQQQNIFKDDQFILYFKLRSAGVREYNDLGRLNMTQRVDGIPEVVNMVLEREENNLYTVTEVSPVTSKFGRDATVVSRSYGFPLKYVTGLIVLNSNNVTLSLRNIYSIIAVPHGHVTNPGLRIEIFPKY